MRVVYPRGPLSLGSHRASPMDWLPIAFYAVMAAFVATTFVLAWVLMRK